MHSGLHDHIQQLLTSDQPPTRRAHLLRTLGTLKVMPMVLDEQVPEQRQDMPEIDVIREHVASQGRTTPAELFDGDGALAAWSDALSDIGGRNLLPLAPLADIVQLMAPELSELDGWLDFIRLLDSATAEVGGQDAAAQRAYQRAIALHDADKICAAIGELHQARVQWWTGDDLHSSGEVLLALGQCYAELHLLEASQQFALGAVTLARAYDRDELRDLVPRGLALAAQAEVLSGRWLRALRLLIPAVAAQADISPSVPDEAFFSSEVLAPLSQMASLVQAARDTYPELGPVIEELFLSAGAEEIRAAILDAPVVSPEEWTTAFGSAGFVQPPFSDAAGTATFAFSAHGVTWRITASSESDEDCCAAARLAATAQIAAVRLAGVDLCLIPGLLSIQAVVDPAHAAGTRTLTDDGRAVLAPYRGPDDSHSVFVEALVTTSTLLFSRSLLPTETFGERSMQAFDGSRSGQDFFAGRDYTDLFLQAAEGTAPTAVSPGQSEATSSVDEHPELAAVGGPGPTYSRARAEKRLAERYQMFPTLIRGTLNQLRQRPDFVETVATLRGEGWLDWHLLQAVHGATRNLPEDFDDSDAEVVTAFLRTPEADTVPGIAPERVTREALDVSRRVGILATLPMWDLELHLPDLRLDDDDQQALQSLMAERYGYWTDDVRHDDPFAGEPGDASAVLTSTD